MGVYKNNNGDLELIAGGTLYADSPIGTIQAYGGSTVPAGWLLCDGSELVKTSYPELYAVIGDNFGTASANTKFCLPDLREATTKGVGLTGKSNNHYDSDGLVLGEFIDDRIQNHDHDLAIRVPGSGSGGWNSVEGTTSDYTYTVGEPTHARFGATTEVKAVGVNYIIKAKQIALPADIASSVENMISSLTTVTTGTGTINSTYVTNGNVVWYKVGKIVTVRINYLRTKALTQDQVIVTGLPRAYAVMYGSIDAPGDHDGHRLITINTNGEIVSNGGEHDIFEGYGQIVYISQD